MIGTLVKNLRKTALNISSWHTNRKIVVIESDDWGSIRMPSKKAFEDLARMGYSVQQDAYSRFDSLESEGDLLNLYEVLSKHKDKNGKSAIVTANSVMANPDFEMIERDRFESYHYESVVDTFKKYPRHSSCFKLWQEGLAKGLFYPQFHGREHVNVALWLRALKEGRKAALDAFEMRTFAINSNDTIGARQNYMAAFDFYSLEDANALDSILEDGLAMFERLFNFRSYSCIAPCYTWSQRTESKLAQLGVKYIQGIAKQKVAFPKGSQYSYKYHRCGQKNRFNQYYTVRNCFFEPSQSPSLWGLDACLNNIKNAFDWKSPVIIGTHRVNFVGFIDESNRDRNLILFDKLLNIIRTKWPDVEFMTSDQLGNLIEAHDGRS